MLRTTPKAQIERLFRNLVAQALDGMPEVRTPAGDIDVLTGRLVIEVKHVKDWKHAVGQALVYGHYYPTRGKVAALFGKINARNQSLIATHCLSLGVSPLFLGYIDDEEVEGIRQGRVRTGLIHSVRPNPVSRPEIFSPDGSIEVDAALRHCQPEAADLWLSMVCVNNFRNMCEVAVDVAAAMDDPKVVEECAQELADIERILLASVGIIDGLLSGRTPRVVNVDPALEWLPADATRQ